MHKNTAHYNNMVYLPLVDIVYQSLFNARRLVAVKLSANYPNDQNSKTNFPLSKTYRISSRIVLPCKIE